MKISVNIPTFNEKKNIKKLINNLLPIADEILLIDNSTDGTPDIAKKASKKVRVIHYSMRDFSKIRNKGIKETKKGWYILYLDADEHLSKELIKEIKNLKKEPRPADAYLIKRKHYFKYDHSIACLTTRFIKGEPKLARKGIIKFINKIHEKALFKIKNPKIAELKGSTLHYPEINKYQGNSDYLRMHVEQVIKEKQLTKTILKYIKQLIKYILIFDYHPKYFKGNIKLWFGTLNYLAHFILSYLKLLKQKNNSIKQ